MIHLPWISIVKFIRDIWSGQPDRDERSMAIEERVSNLTKREVLIRNKEEVLNARLNRLETKGTVYVVFGLALLVSGFFAVRFLFLNLKGLDFYFVIVTSLFLILFSFFRYLNFFE